MNFSEKGIVVKPFLPNDVNDITLLGLKYRDTILDFHISGTGTTIDHFSINGKKMNECFVAADSKGKFVVEIELH